MGILKYFSLVFLYKKRILGLSFFSPNEKAFFCNLFQKTSNCLDLKSFSLYDRLYGSTRYIDFNFIHSFSTDPLIIIHLTLYYV